MTLLMNIFTDIFQYLQYFEFEAQLYWYITQFQQYFYLTLLNLILIFLFQHFSLANPILFLFFHIIFSKFFHRFFLSIQF